MSILDMLDRVTKPHVQKLETIDDKWYVGSAALAVAFVFGLITFGVMLMFKFMSG